MELSFKVADREKRTHVKTVITGLGELSSHLQNRLNDADWTAKREVIRAVVQRIEIGMTRVVLVLRLPPEKSTRTLEPVMVTLSRA